MAPDESRAQYLASGSADTPHDHERLDLIRAVLAVEATWAEPPPEVADGLLAAVAEEARPLPAAPLSRGSSRWPLVAALAGGLVAMVALVLSTVSVLDAERETVVTMSGTDLESSAAGRAAVRPTHAGWWIRLDVTGLPPAPAGSYYEGWVWSDAGVGVSIGTFHLRGGDAPVILWSGVALADYPSIWVTLEDEDDGPDASELVVMTGRIPDLSED